MKRFIAGFITCLILLSAIFMTGFAENALNVFLNTFPIYINGQKIEVEAYNINGRTFVSIGDVAKYFGATVVNNETEKKIEIKADIPKTLTNTKSKIEYDPITGEIVGAEYIENEKNGIKYTTILYNGEIYISSRDLKNVFGINQGAIDIKNGLRTFYKGDKHVTINLRSDDYFDANGSYFKMVLFESLMGD